MFGKKFWYKSLWLSIIAIASYSSMQGAPTTLTPERVCSLDNGKYPYSLTMPWRGDKTSESLVGIIKKSPYLYALEEQSIVRYDCKTKGMDRIPIDLENQKMVEVLSGYLIVESSDGWIMVDLTNYTSTSLMYSTIKKDSRVQKYLNGYEGRLRITRLTKDMVYVQIMRTHASQSIEYGKKSFSFPKNPK